MVGRKVSKHRLLSDIHETALSSIGLPVDAGSDTVTMFGMVLAEGRGLIRQRAEIEQRAEALLGENPTTSGCPRFPASRRSTR